MINYEQEKERVKQAAAELNRERKAEQDLWQMTRELGRANKRKATVPWAFPIEVAQMITPPCYMTKPEQQMHGLGYSVSLEGLEVPKLQVRLKRHKDIDTRAQRRSGAN